MDVEALNKIIEEEAKQVLQPTASLTDALIFASKAKELRSTLQGKENHARTDD